MNNIAQTQAPVTQSTGIDQAADRQFPSSPTAQSLVVFDAGVEGYSLLAAAVEDQTAVAILDKDQDGVVQLILALSRFSAAINVHIIAHGAPGCLYLGNSQLSLDTLDRYAWDLLVGCSKRSLSLSLYGCNVAAGDAGAEFIQKLHRFTGANIAASTTLTGNAAKDGDWNLAYRVGEAESRLPISEATLATYPGILNAPVIKDLTDVTKETRATGEGTARTISGISIEDQSSGNFTVTIKADHGKINLASTAGLTVTNDGSGNITIVGLLNEINTALNGMTYSPTDTMTSASGKIDDYSGAENIKITVTDSGGLSTTRDVPLDITPVNDAPTLLLSAATALEGGSVAFTASNFGIVDIDNVDAQVMIKISELPGKGYLTLNGAKLVPGSLFSVEDIAGLTYHHDGTQTTSTGGLADSFKFTVDDGAGGTIAATAMPINITPVNQLPTVSGSNSLFEGQLDFPVSINIGDPDQLAASYQVQILSLPADGILKLNGVAVAANQLLSSADLSKLTYSHDGNDANFGNPPDVQFNIKVTDDGGGTGTPGSTTSTIKLQIKPNNDDPLLTKNTGLTYDANQDPDGVGVGQDQFSRLITANELKLADPDSSTSQLTYTLTQAADGTIGKLQLFSGGAWSTLSAGASFSQSDIDKGRLRYTFQKNQAGTFNDSFKFQVRDSEITEYIPGQPGVSREGGIWNAGGTALEVLTFNIQVTAPVGPGDQGAPTISANVAPIEIIVGQAATLEAGSATITKAMLEYTDVDNVPDQIVYRITQTPTGGVVKLDGVAIARFGSFTQQDVNDGKVTFQHAGDEDFIDGFKFTVSDGTNVTAEKEFKFDITPINDAPVISVKGSPYLAEGGTVGLTNVFFTVSDVDGSGEKSGQGFAKVNTLTFKVVDLPDNGILQVLRGGTWQTIDANTLLTKAELDGGNLRYTHNGGETIADSFQVQAYDDSGAANNSSNLATVSIEIAPFNDLPYFSSSKSLEVFEAATGLIKGSNGKAGNEAHIEYLDPDNSTLQRQFRITKAVANGQLLKDGQAMAVGSIFTQKELDEGKITYKHNGSETTADRFEFQVSDGSGSSVPGAYDILVKPINDAPLLSTPGTQFLIDTDTITFSGANGNRIVVTDPDLAVLQSGEVDIMRVTLEAQLNGVTYTDSLLTLASSNGITIVSQASGTVTFEGSLANVQAALDGLKLQTLTDVDGVLKLKVTADDRDNGGQDPNPGAGGFVVSKDININASEINDQAQIIAPNAGTANEDGSLLFNDATGTGFASKLQITDVDDFGRTMMVEVSIGASLGVLNATGAAGNGSNKLTFTGSKDQINAALASLGFTPAANYNGDVTLKVNILDEGGGTVGISRDVAITVNPLNDTPVLTTPTAVQVINSGNPLMFTGNVINVNDNADIIFGSSPILTVTIEAKKASDGSIYGQLNTSGSGITVGGNGTGTLTITGTQANINNALNNLAYTPTDYNVDATVNLIVKVDDSNNGAELTGSVGAPTTVIQNVVVNISGTNDKPVLSAPSNSISVLEDGAFTFAGTGNMFVVADPDDFGANNLVATVKVDKGVLSLAGIDGTTVTGSGSDLMTIRGTEAQINAALDGLIFTPTANYHGTAKLDVTINDGGNTGTGGAQEDTKTIFITVNPANDRPTATGISSIGTVAEDNATPTSVLISSLIGTNYSDSTDNQTGSGGGTTETGFSYVAVTNNSSIAAQGVWQFKNGSDIWIDIPAGTLGDSSAVVIRADREIRFKPAADFHGTPGSLQVKIADSSVAIVESTSAIDRKDLSTDGGTTQTGAWSSGTMTIVTGGVTALNDAPTITNPTSSANLSAILEDAASPTGNTVSGLFGTKYRDTTDDKSSIAGGGNSLTAFGGIAIIGNAATAAQGNWQYQLNGSSTWVSIPVSGLSDTAAMVLPTNARLRFMPAADYNGTPGQLTVRFSDSTVAFNAAANLGTVGGTSNWSSLSTTLATSVTAVNDAPILGGSGVLGGSYTEQLTAVNVGADLSGISDVEITRGERLDNTLTATVKITDFLSGDQLSFAVGSTGVTVIDNGNGTYTLSGTGASRANLLQVMQSAVFSSTSDNPTNYGTDSDRTIAFQVNDNNGPNNLSNTVNTIISIVGVNDSPDAINDSKTIAEETVNVTGSVRTNDTDPDNLNNTLTVSAVNGNAGDVGKTITGKYGTLVINTDGSYTYNLNNSDPLVQQLGVGKSLTDEVFNYTISDGSLTDSAQLTITVTGTNDAPIAVADSNSIFEDASAPALGNVIAGAGGIGKDSDIDLGDILSVSTVNGLAGNVGKTVAGKYGTLTLNADGSYSYNINNGNSAVQALGVGKSLTDEVFSYQVSDGQGGTANTTLTITINGTNDVPVAIADANSAIAGQPAATGNLLGNDSDVDTGDILGVTNIDFGGTSKPLGTAFSSQYGTLTVNADGTYSYVVDASNPTVIGLGQGQTLTETFTYTVSDGKGGSATATLKITVGGINDAPVATLDANSIFEDAASPVMGNALTNDTDPDNDLLSVTAVNGAAGNLGKPVSGLYGTLTVNADGTYSYGVNNANGTVQALAVGETITDTFSYLISDGKGGSSTANIVITINGTNDVPIAVADINNISEDALNPATGNVLSNDTDRDTTDILTVSAVNGVAGNVGNALNGTYGSLMLNSNGTYSYTLDSSKAAVQELSQGDQLTETFTYSVSDGEGGSSSTTLTITINGTNDGPTAVADTNSIFEDAAVPATGNVITGLGGAGKDLDPDKSDILNVSLVNGSAAGVGQPVNGSYGSLTLSANGSYSYSISTTNPQVQELGIGETLTETFTYQISDGKGGFSDTTLTITVNGTNDAPIALLDTNSVTDDGVLIATGNALGNDRDPDKTDILSVTQLNGSAANLDKPTTGTYGSITLNANGSYTYQLDNSNPLVHALGAGETALDTFTYQISDGKGGFSTSQIQITINGTNDGPVAVGDVNSLFEDAVNPVLGNVIAGDAGGLGRDTDQDTNDILRVTQVNGDPANVGKQLTGQYGALVLRSDGSYGYQVNNASPSVQELGVGEALTETFTYQISDGKGGTSQTTLTITINGTNDAPVAFLDTNSVTDDVATPATGNLLSTDRDPDKTDILRVTQVDGDAGNLGKPVVGTYGSLTVSADGTYSYTLDNSNPLVHQLGVGETALETFTYQISDGKGGFSTAQVQITVNGSNDGPVAVADINSIFEDALNPATGNVIAGAAGGAGKDLDLDKNDILTVTQVNGLAANVGNALAGNYGSITLNADGTYSYGVNNGNPLVQALSVGETLTETFNYQISDGKGGSSATTITITINGTNDAPVATADFTSITESTLAIDPTRSGNVLGNDTDIDGDPLLVSAVGSSSDPLNANNVNDPVLGAYGSIVMKADGSYTYTVNTNNPAVAGLGAGETLTETFTYQISDGQGGFSSTNLTITIGGDNNIPDAVNDFNSLFEDMASVGGNLIAGNSGVGKDLDPDTNDVLSVAQVNGLASNLNKAVAGNYGSILVQADGSYSYALDNTNPLVQGLAVGESITDTFTYQVADGKGGFDIATVTIRIDGTNDAPLASADINSVTEDLITPATGNVLVNDSDIDGDPLTVATVAFNGTNGVTNGTVGNPLVSTYGSLTLNANGSYSYVLDSSNPGVQELGLGESLTETFTYSVTDPFGGTSQTTLTITINGSNDGPTAVADTNSIFEDATAPATGNVIQGMSGVGKDLDPDKTDILNVTQVNGSAANLGQAVNGTYGSLVLNTDGSYSYDVNNGNGAVQGLAVGQTLTDRFTYQISDGKGGFSDTTLTITIDGTNDAPIATADTNSVTEDLTTPATGNVLLNDRDIDGDTLLVSGLTVNNNPATLGQNITTTYGTLTLNANGTYSFTVDSNNPSVQALGVNATLTEVFTYEISDPFGGKSTAQLTITIGGTNDVPVAMADINRIAEDALNPAIGNVITDAMTGDSDLDGDQLSVVQVNGNAGQVGQAITSNYGSLTLNADGSYRYVLDNSNGTVQALSVGETLTESFTYQISDGQGGTAITTLTITIDGTNDAPIATADTNSVMEDIATPAQGNVLPNDRDIDGDVLTVVQVNGDPTKVGSAFNGSYGSLLLNANGSYSYSLDNSNSTVQALGNNETLTETFTYQISDGNGGFSDTTLTITINGTNDGVVAVADSNVIGEDALTPVTGTVLDNDIDIDGDPLSVTLVNGEANNVGKPLNGLYGGLTLNADGSYSYSIDNSNPVVQSLAVGETITDRFTYQVSDGNTTSTTTITITVNGTNDAPTAVADLGFIAEDAVSPTLGNVLFNDTDPDQSDKLTVSAVNGDPNATGNSVLGEYGTLVLNTDGSYSYTVDNSNPAVSQLAPGTQLTETFTYQITDGQGEYSTATLKIAIGENDAPLSQDKAVTATEDVPYVFTTGDFAFTDADYGDSLSAVRIDNLPTNGKLMLDGQPVLAGQVVTLADVMGGKLSFASASDANGDAYAQFNFSVKDSSGADNSFSKVPSTITLNVTPVNDAPILDLDGNNSSATGSGYSTMFAPGSPIAIADLDTQVTDIDSSNIQSATITLTTRPNGSSEFLTVLSGLPAGITASAYNPATGELKLSGSATLASYQAAIATIGYGNESSLRNNSTREITVVVNDGTLNSNVAKTQIFYDTDSDGVADVNDLDADNDGIPDLIEMGGNPNRDTDGDGILDSLDLDSDNDGLSDLEEAGFSASLLKVLDANNDGVIDLTNSVGKNGLADILETFPDSGVLKQKPIDTDKDGAYDFQDLDSDNDGSFDLKESGRGFADLNNDGKVDGLDRDGDGIRDGADGSDKFGRAAKGRLTDSNNNSIPDYMEVNKQRPGGSGSDVIIGTDGDDILGGFSDLDILDGRGGNDIIMGGSDRDRLYGGEGNDTIMGGSNDDYIEGNAGDDILNGGSGNDLIYGGSGNDRINAGQGNDIVFGEAGNDRITGNEGNDKLYGGDGKDILIGGRGNDTLVGGRGKDKMTGGQGRDKFVYSSVKDFGDTITDFEIVKDRFDLGDLLKGGSMSDVQFKQKGSDTLVQVDAGKGFQNLATLQNVDADTMGSRHFNF